MPMKTILHIDMDAFFAAVEVRDNPELEGQPVIIGALPHQRGVVSTCSYEARKFGIHSAMNIKEAYRRCPDGIYLHPNMRKYSGVSAKIKDILLDFTDTAEFVALDEGYLDITYTMHLFGGAQQVAMKIKQRIKDELNLTCSVGIGYNMMTAKLASEEMKPDGLFCIMDHDTLDRLILDRPVGVIYGVGKKTQKLLEQQGIFTVNQLRKQQLPFIKSILGNLGIDIYNLCRGIDHRKVTPNEAAKSYGRETTYQEDTNDISLVRSTLIEIIKELSFHLKKREQWCRTVTLKIKYSDMRSITRSKTVDEPINGTKMLYHITEELLKKVDKNHYIRLVGLSLSNLTDAPYQQLSLDTIKTSHRNKEHLSHTVFSLKKKYGMDIIKDSIDYKQK